MSAKLVVGIVLVASGLYLLHRLALWVEQRGWIYYRRSGRASSVGSAFLETQAMLEPEKRHLAEIVRAEQVEETESGLPRPPGSRRRGGRGGSSDSLVFCCRNQL